MTKLPPNSNTNAQPGTKAVDGGESARDEKLYRHSGISSDKHKPFSDKIFMFPPEYNALRRELDIYWPQLWAITQWSMAYKAEDFVSVMNEALDMAIVFDTEKVAFICRSFLEELQRRRDSTAAHDRIEKTANFHTGNLLDFDDPDVQRQIQGVAAPKSRSKKS